MITGVKINPDDYGNLEAAIKRIENAGSPFIYVDISDGAYVNSFTSGLLDLKYIARTTTLPIYLCLKIKNPLENIDLFLNVLRKGDVVFIYPDSEYQYSITLQKIIDAGLIPGIGISEKNQVKAYLEVLNVVDKVLVESLNRKTLISKLEELHEIGNECHFATVVEMNEHEGDSLVADEIICCLAH